MPRVSVIIPTYNRAHLLPDCINSVLTQTCRDFEVIVVDDGSTDNTRQVVAAFPVRYCYQHHQTGSVARNSGLKLSQSQYIIFLDSDDALMSAALEKEVKILDSNHDVGFCYGQSYEIDGRGRIFGLWKPRPEKSCVREGRAEIADLILGNYIPSPTVMIRRSCLEEIGAYNTAFKSGSQDFELWVRLAKRYAVAYIAEPLAKYRVHTHSLSYSRREDEIEETNALILESIFRDGELGQSLSPQRPKAYSYLYVRLAEHAYSCGRMKVARRYLNRAITVRPREFISGFGLHNLLLLAKTFIPARTLISFRERRRRLKVAKYMSVSQVRQDRENIGLKFDIAASEEAPDISQGPQEEGLSREEACFAEDDGEETRQALDRQVSGRQDNGGSVRLLTYQCWKEIADRFLALLALLILSPFSLIIAIGIRLDSPGNPIYAQERVGKDGRPFRIYKFRTMYLNHDDNEYKDYLRKYVLENAAYRVDEKGEPVYKVVDDPRITRFGGWLRQTNLDELPQLINILKGEMSFVGPRPDIPFTVAMYNQWHRKRLCSKPGITGSWQVSGRKALSFEDMVCMDIDYIQKQSLLKDLNILWRTVKTVLSRDGS